MKSAPTCINRNSQGAGDVFAAVQHAVTRLQGAYALAVIRVLEPDRMILAREGSPLMLGRGENGYFAASDASALVAVTRDLIYLENGDVACVTPGGCQSTMGFYHRYCM